MVMVFPKSTNVFQQENASCHTSETGDENFGENEEFKVLTCAPNSRDLRQAESVGRTG